MESTITCSKDRASTLFDFVSPGNDSVHNIYLVLSKCLLIAELLLQNIRQT